MTHSSRLVRLAMLTDSAKLRRRLLRVSSVVHKLKLLAPGNSR